VLHDQSLTPLFTYVAILNSLGTYERQTGATSISAQGQISFDGIGTVSIDDAFTGDQAVSLAAAAIMNPIGAMAANTFGPALPRTVDLTLRVSETEDYSTIERVWLDTTRPTLGGTHILHVLLRQYRADEGATEVISLPITMPTQASGPVTLLVSDGPSLTTLEQSAVTPGPPTSLDGLLARIRNIRSSNRLYVRLLTAATGLAAGGEAQPSLPASVQAALDADTSGTTTPLTRTVVGTWDRRMPRVLRGSRELTLTLRPAVSPAVHCHVPHDRLHTHDHPHTRLAIHPRYFQHRQHSGPPRDARRLHSWGHALKCRRAHLLDRGVAGRVSQGHAGGRFYRRGRSPDCGTSDHRCR
jgi:hypothetical protein